MIQTIRKAWGIPELRKKIVFTLLILLIFRLGNAIMVPYINRDALALQMQVWGTGLLGLYNVMSGGAFATATVFALSIQPYINSSIIIQLLTVAIPALERLENSSITELALLNTIPETQGAGCSKIKYLSVAPMFGEAIERIYQEISISKLFN